MKIIQVNRIFFERCCLILPVGSADIERASKAKESLGGKLRQFDALIENSVISEILQESSVSQFIKRNFAISEASITTKELERYFFSS